MDNNISLNWVSWEIILHMVIYTKQPGFTISSTPPATHHATNAALAQSCWLCSHLGSLGSGWCGPLLDSFRLHEPSDDPNVLRMIYGLHQPRITFWMSEEHNPNQPRMMFWTSLEWQSEWVKTVVPMGQLWFLFSWNNTNVILLPMSDVLRHFVSHFCSFWMLHEWLFSHE